MKMSSNMKVCMIVQDPMVKGGIAAVVNGYRGSKLEKQFRINYVESYKDGNKITKILKAIIGYTKFLKLLLIDKPDIIHIHSSFGPSFFRKIPFIYFASWAKKPIINHIHGADFEEFYNNASFRKKKLIRKIYNKCSHFIALSDEWREKLKLIVPEECISVVENYSIPQINALDERMKRSSNNQILFLGEIGQRKGCYDIPEVVEKVLMEIPQARFILGGSGDIKVIEALLREKGIDSNVVFPGWVRGDEKDKLLKSSDIFFLPSYNEGMPMSILDAMGYGLPIVSTNVGGIPRIVSAKNGHICNPGDKKELAKSIVSILNNNNKLKSLSLGSYEIVKEKYSLELHVKALEELYMKLGGLHEKSN